MFSRWPDAFLSRSIVLEIEVPATYLHVGAEYSQYLINTKCLCSIRPPSPSLAMLSPDWETGNKLSCLSSWAAPPLSRKEAQEHSGQNLLFTEQETGQEEHFPRHLDQQHFCTLFVATSPQSLGAVSQPGDSWCVCKSLPTPCSNLEADRQGKLG